MFGSLCERNLTDFPNLKDYKAVIALIREAQKLRNKYTHNVIGMEKTKGAAVAKIATISARGKLKKELQPVALIDIICARDKIKSSVHATYRLVLNADPVSSEKLT